MNPNDTPVFSGPKPVIRVLPCGTDWYVLQLLVSVIDAEVPHLLSLEVQLRRDSIEQVNAIARQINNSLPGTVFLED